MTSTDEEYGRGPPLSVVPPPAHSLTRDTPYRDRQRRRAKANFQHAAAVQTADGELNTMCASRVYIGLMRV